MSAHSWFVVILALACSVEYIGRFVKSETKNYITAGKAIVRIYLALSYLTPLFFPHISTELRHSIRGNAIEVWLLVELFYIILENILRYYGRDKRNRWMFQGKNHVKR